MLASLLCCNGRFSSDYTDYETADRAELHGKDGVSNTNEKTQLKTGNGKTTIRVPEASPEEADGGADSAYSTAGSITVSAPAPAPDLDSEDTACSLKSTSSGTLSAILTDDIDNHITTGSNDKSLVNQAFTLCHTFEVQSGTQFSQERDTNQTLQSEHMTHGPEWHSEHETHGPKLQSEHGTQCLALPKETSDGSEADNFALSPALECLDWQAEKDKREDDSKCSAGKSSITINELQVPQQVRVFNIQQCISIDDTVSDTLSIISEATEPSDVLDNQSDGNVDSDTDTIVHDNLDKNQSDKSAEISEEEIMAKCSLTAFQKDVIDRSLHFANLQENWLEDQQKKVGLQLPDHLQDKDIGGVTTNPNEEKFEVDARPYKNDIHTFITTDFQFTEFTESLDQLEWDETFKQPLQDSLCGAGFQNDSLVPSADLTVNSQLSHAVPIEGEKDEKSTMYEKEFGISTNLTNSLMASSLGQDHISVLGKEGSVFDNLDRSNQDGLELHLHNSKKIGGSSDGTKGLSEERPPDHQEKISEDTSQTNTSVPVTETILGDDGQNMGEKRVQSDASSSESSTPRASLEIHEVPKVLQELPTLSSSVENVNAEILLVPSLPQSLSGSLVEPPLHSHEQTTAPEGHTLLEMVEPDPKGAHYGYLSPSADASFVPLHSPSFDTDNARPSPGVSRSSPSRSSPSGSRTQLSEGDHGTGTESPEKRSHLSVPTIRTSSHSESQEERSFEDDDENIDNEFTSQRYGSSLSVSRNNIGDSRESLASVYSDAGEINYGRIPVTGDITFGLEYDPRRSVLNINIKNCTDLAPVDTKHNRSDPYVKVYLLPEKTRSGKRKSKIKKHTLNPVYNEVLTYNISQGELENRTLWVTVWHSDRFGRNDFLGEVVIPMDTYRFDDPTPCTYALQTRMPEAVNEATMQYKGDLIVSFMYVTPEKVATNNGQKSKSKSKKTKSAGTTDGELHVLIKSAKNLMAARSNGSSDPFVKGYLLPDRTRGSKQKTPVVKNSVNPMWNHIMVFDGISQAELPERSLELTIWDHEKLGTNEFLGGVRTNLGQGKYKGAQVDWMDARGEEISLWQSVIDHPNSWIDAKLPLRASMGKTSKK